MPTVSGVALNGAQGVDIADGVVVVEALEQVNGLVGSEYLMGAYGFTALW